MYSLLSLTRPDEDLRDCDFRTDMCAEHCEKKLKAGDSSKETETEREGAEVV